MRWLKRGLWLSAWGVWAWLGVGLYRELPRQFDQPLCTLPLRGIQTIIGFVGETDLFVQVLWEDNGESTRVEVYDAVTGVMVGQSPGPSINNFPIHRLPSEHYPVMVTRARPRAPLPEYGLFLLNLKTMQWRRLAEQQPLAVSVHPTRPWMVAVLETPRPYGKLVVFDFETGRELFSRDAGRNHHRRAAFLHRRRATCHPVRQPRDAGRRCAIG
jgi:hypothetical protein